MQITSIAKKLELAGLTEKQAKVYVASLFLGPAAVQRIAEQAEVNRATTYVILDELLELGLVSETTEGKKSLFVAEPPEAIDRYLTSMEREIGNRREELKKSMKELKQISRAEVSNAPVVRFFKGPEAIKAIESYSKRKAKQNETVYSMVDIDELLKFFPDQLTQGPKRRSKKQISSKLFYSSKSTEVPTDTRSKRSTKRLNEKILGDVSIYNDRMTIVHYNGDNSSGVIIEGKEIVGVIRQLFELAWNNSKSNK